MASPTSKETLRSPALSERGLVMAQIRVIRGIEDADPMQNLLEPEEQRDLDRLSGRLDELDRRELGRLAPRVTKSAGFGEMIPEELQIYYNMIDDA